MDLGDAGFENPQTTTFRLEAAKLLIQLLGTVTFQNEKTDEIVDVLIPELIKILKHDATTEVQ